MNRLLLMFAALFAVAADAPDRPDDYALRLPVQLTDGAIVARLPLPALVMASARTGDLADLRVFDSDGRVLPMRMADEDDPASSTTLPALPVRGKGGVATAALFDARALSGVANTLTLATVLPEAQPVRLTVESSENLQDWEPLGEQTAYRAPGTPPATVQVKLSGGELRGDWLRVRWSAEGKLLATPAIISAILALSNGSEQFAFITAQSPPLVERAIEFGAPSPIAIASLRVTLPAGARPLPVRVLVRDNAEQPWREIGSGLAAPQANNIALGENAKYFRVEAQGGFDAAPTLTLGYEAQAIDLLTQGARRPLTLAVGRAEARAVWLTDETPLPAVAPVAATVTLPTTPLRLEAVPERRDRSWVLWGVVGLATLVLAALAWRLLREVKRA